MITEEAIQQHEFDEKPNLSRKIARWIMYLGLCVLFGLALSLYTMAMSRNAFTFDFGWLVRTGDVILRLGYLPTTDVFSWSNAERPWVLYQWLFEVMVSLGHQFFGLQGLMRVFIASVVLLYVGYPLYTGKRQNIPLLFTLFVCSIAILTATVNVSLRPLIISTVIMLVQHIIIHRHRQGKTSFKAVAFTLIPIYALWGNTHTGVVLGFFALLMMAVGDQVERWGWYRFTPQRPELEGQPLPFTRYALLAATAFGASLLNPYGIGIYTYLADLSSQGFLNDKIIELQSPNFHGLPFQFFLVNVAVAVMLLTRTRKVYAAQDLALLFFFMVNTLFVQRFVVWTCLYFVLILPKALAHAWDEIRDRHRAMDGILSGFNAFRPVIVSMLFVAMAAYLAAPQFFPKIRPGQCVRVLKGINAYQKLKRPDDKLLNDSDTGSCMIYYYPNQKVFIDTRFDFYGGQFVQEQHEANSMISNWEGFLRKWQINTILLKKTWPLTRYLAADGSYIKLYEDRHMMILRKKAQGN